MLGHEAIRRFGRAFDVHASVKNVADSARFDLAAELHGFDAFAPDTIPGLLEDARPDVVVNCIGIVKQLEDASRPSPAIAINALFPHRLAEECATHGCRLIHVSTDCVFSGLLSLGRAYTEDDVADARDLYGLSKLLGEVTVAPALTLRTSIIGWELQRAVGLLAWFAETADRHVRGYTRAVFSGLTTRAFSDVLLEIALSHPGLTGLYHVAAEPISKFDLLQMINSRLELERKLEPVDEPVINRALDPARLRAATGIGAPSWEEMLDDYLLRDREMHEANA
jgi:dTDP-4-dehydrorhamnose reductase